ncbi:MAG: biotin/lipoyl-binding carrier protein [Chloroflexi bacterium]|nr:biotin/lipoyl-binding carrier protein [Chloroflexota bacterium]MBM3172958.1 biotin/lipoyl-binding carrier protein [Chloroflexota bacterium]MBM3175839.1 biotin/lipoyl-binding carrier protein [Chloroflexota bacterium]MBM4450284.1 biotin/lipoyl-binding carrier protein [Chloroflexota bacterium]
MTEILSPITGSVWKIITQTGAQVNEGDTVVILESMKMEIKVKAPHNGKVTEIKVKESDSILEDDIIAIIE